MNSKNAVVGMLILVLLVGGVYIIYKRAQRMSPPPAIENTLTNSTPEPSMISSPAASASATASASSKLKISPY